MPTTNVYTIYFLEIVYNCEYSKLFIQEFYHERMLISCQSPFLNQMMIVWCLSLVIIFIDLTMLNHPCFPLRKPVGLLPTVDDILMLLN